MLVYSWGYGWPLSSHSVKLVHSRQFNSVLQAWFMWNPKEHNPMALGVLEAERCCWQSNVDRKVSAPKTILAGKPNSSFRPGGDPSSQQTSRFVLCGLSLVPIMAHLCFMSHPHGNLFFP